MEVLLGWIEDADLALDWRPPPKRWRHPPEL